MNARTYEILAKWIGQRHGIRVVFEPGSVPVVNIKNKIITLPTEINTENAFVALTALMHEAAHIKYTGEIPTDIVPDSLSHNILNAIEDIRIDLKNFQLLPNIHEFYRHAVNLWVKEREKQKGNELPDDVLNKLTNDPDAAKWRKKLTLLNTCLKNGIMKREWFDDAIDNEKEALKMEQDHNISDKMQLCVDAIERKDWDIVKRIVADLVRLFKLEDMPKKPVPKEGEQGEGEGTGKALGYKQGLTKENGETCFQGQGTDRVTGCKGQAENISFHEITKQRFKELLDMKEVKIIYEGHSLNTDELTSFLTGDIDELFTDDIIERRKKSKIIICMDASGSMSSPLLDGKDRKSVVAGCVKEIVSILDEICLLEGLNIDYSLKAFDDGCYDLNKESWEREYFNHSGGTSLRRAFKISMDELLKDQELDGNKLIIFFSDGDVCTDEIDEMKQVAIRHGGEIKCILIGVGANITGDYVSEVVGDFNILNKDSADLILMDAICTLLSM